MVTTRGTALLALQSKFASQTDSVTVASRSSEILERPSDSFRGEDSLC